MRDSRMLYSVYFVSLYVSLVLSYKVLLDFVPEFYVKTTKVECDFDPKWVENLSCTLKPINWTTTLTNLSSDLVIPLRNASMHLQIFRRETRYLPFLVNITRNFCDMFKESGLDYYSRVLLDAWKQFSNLKPKCPIEGHLEIRDIAIPPKSFPMTMPTGSYKVVFRLIEGYPPQHFGTVRLYINLIEKPKVSRKNKKS